MEASFPPLLMDAHTSPPSSVDATRSRNVSFIDDDGEIANVHIELRTRDGKAQFSVTNDGESGSGQHYFKPRTAAQKKLLTLWNEYHLNDMHAGTVEQEKAIDEWKKEDPAHYSYDAIVSFLKSKKLYVHLLPDGTPYTYGSAWLYRDLPVDIWEQVESVCQSIEEEMETIKKQATAYMQSLMLQGKESAHWRGHNLGPWLMSDNCTVAIAQCVSCDKQCVIRENPLPNEIDIGGEAVAHGCIF